MKTRTYVKTIACFVSGTVLAFSGAAQAAVVVNDDFSSGTLDGWNVVSGSWSVIDFNGSNVAEATSGNSQLQTVFSSSIVSAFTINFDYGWEWGVNDFTLQLGVKLLDNGGNGYAYTIRQAAAGYKYELFTVTGGADTSLLVSGNAPSESGGQPLVGASLTWDGTTLRGYQGGDLVISTSPGLQYDTFNQLVLQQVGLNGHARFDNIVVDVTAVPEPGTSVLLGLSLLSVVIMRRRFRRPSCERSL
ncbi:PEP-CTERM protein-sorting domain-containing protein [Terrimicrobium sacchariphilum]|jgi:hypothetical protein|uniref:PEP-CTERM protein-sorting domain-containing protein n=1 Tax=Terrimicrobium sacchariphilum TaxID=690879 RepID=A0A146G3M7_TERSA|nr:PEP-CTERM sorting domain-containing protein [Terrimicrobium sacchariphilum]GAT32250.1 PEP-CTERM protein-sorting domain-containing protein [Terrimicrobium sacchariphilum]